MCGLFGVVSQRHLNHTEKQVLSELGFLSALRGTDSTGLLTLTKKKKKSPVNYQVRRSLDNPVTFMITQETNERIGHHHLVGAIGHARAATHGYITEDNAHPITEGHIVGTHNGVANAFAPNDRASKTESDSRLLFRYLAEHGVDEVFHKLYLPDAAALVWFDTEYSTVNWVRNDKRPLFMLNPHKGGTLFYASEERMLVMAADRCKLSYNPDDVYALKEKTVCTFSVYTGEWHVRPIKEKVTVPYKRVFTESKETTALVPWKNDNKVTSIFKPKPVIFLDDLPEVEKKGEVVPLVQPPLADDAFRKVLDTLEEGTKKDEALYEIDQAVAETETDVLRRHKFLKKATASEFGPDFDDERLSYRMPYSGRPALVTVATAKKYLSNGCASCDLKPLLTEPVYWHDTNTFLCADCIVDSLDHLYYYIPGMAQLAGLVKSGLYCNTSKEKKYA